MSLPKTLFSVELPDAPPDKRVLWQEIMTRAANKALLESPEFMNRIEQRYNEIMEYWLETGEWL